MTLCLAWPIDISNGNTPVFEHGFCITYCSSPPCLLRPATDGAGAAERNLVLMAWYHRVQNVLLPEDFNLTSPSLVTKMPSARTISQVALSTLSIAQVALGMLSPIQRHPRIGVSESCSNPQLSCHNTTAVSNLCCFNAPGGSLLQTQFWDTDPVSGPSNSWTVHGLWVGGLVLCDRPTVCD
jgi:hypothetical protein